MLQLLFAPLTGLIAASLYGLNSLFWPWFIFLFALLRFLPIPAWQKKCDGILHQIPVLWTDINNYIIQITTNIKWDVQGLENLQAHHWYLLICNHQSWVDIFVLNYIFNRKIPTLKFFMKKELIWTLPILGWAAMLADFPILYRTTKEDLAKHPHLKGKDIEITRKACEKFKKIPTTVINFVEGTRFTAEKQLRQRSQYQHLLRPKAGGIAFALATMGEYFNEILNVTIIYPDGIPTMWDFFCGRVKKIIVRATTIPLTSNLLGDYENNREYRIFFQNWLNQIWEEKDKIITKTTPPTS